MNNYVVPWGNFSTMLNKRDSHILTRKSDIPSLSSIQPRESESNEDGESRPVNTFSQEDDKLHPER